MAKTNKQGSQKPETNTNTSKTADTKKSGTGAASKEPLVAASKDPVNKGRQSAKSSRSRVGGTAVPGAKSTQPKEITATNPQQQQAESYNRDMRRRMHHLGTGPEQAGTMQDQRKKRLEKRKRRIEERRQEVKKVAASGPRRITLGRRNTYFLIAVAVLIIAIIIIAIILNHNPH
jgi:hypothetical protein